MIKANPHSQGPWVQWKWPIGCSVQFDDLVTRHNSFSASNPCTGWSLVSTHSISPFIIWSEFHVWVLNICSDRSDLRSPAQTESHVSISCDASSHYIITCVSTRPPATHLRSIQATLGFLWSLFNQKTYLLPHHPPELRCPTSMGFCPVITAHNYRAYVAHTSDFKQLLDEIKPPRQLNFHYPWPGLWRANVKDKGNCR